VRAVVAGPAHGGGAGIGKQAEVAVGLWSYGGGLGVAVPFLLCDQVRFSSILATGLGRFKQRPLPTHNNPLTCCALELWDCRRNGSVGNSTLMFKRSTGRSSAGEFLLVRVGGSRSGFLVSLSARDGVVDEESEAPASWNVQFVGCEISCRQPLFYLQLAPCIDVITGMERP
jgi:hypothetical protein